MPGTGDKDEVSIYYITVLHISNMNFRGYTNSVHSVMGSNIFTGSGNSDENIFGRAIILPATGLYFELQTHLSDWLLGSNEGTVVSLITDRARKRRKKIVWDSGSLTFVSQRDCN